MNKTKYLTLASTTLISLSLTLTGCSSNPTPTPTPSQSTADLFVSQDGNCGNLVQIFTDSLDKMKKTGIVETYSFGDAVFTSVYDPNTKFDNYIGVRYDKTSDGYYKIPTLENFALVGDYELLTLDGNTCVNDSKTQMTIANKNGNKYVISVNNGIITSIEATDKEGSTSKKNIFYNLDDRAKGILKQQAQD